MIRSKEIIMLGLVVLAAAIVPGRLEAMKLSGQAQDLWGSTVDLSTYNRGTVIIYPFSPSN